jgi:type II secretory pathway pseudopilin PulG
MRLIRKAKAFTLVEIIVVLVLAAVVVAGMIKLYVSVNAGNQLQNAIATISQQGRFVISRINTSVKQAGDKRCLSPSAPKLLAPAVAGFSAKNTPSAWRIKPVKDSDVLLVASCINYKNKKQYLQTAYYVKQSRRKNTSGMPINALYEKIKGARSVELAEGVDALHFSYGVGTADKMNIKNYVDEGKVKHWSDVRVVRMSVTLDSIEPILQHDHYRVLSKVWHAYIMVPMP